MIHSTLITYLPEVNVNQVKEFEKVANKNLGANGRHYVIKVLATEKIDSDSVSHINGWRHRSFNALYDLTNNSLIANKNFLKTNFFKDDI